MPPCPYGGTDLSVTEGIVSRIEHAGYYYSTQGLRIQIDAALNPGNSGGPAVLDRKIVGLVFSTIVEAENIGYLIPVEEIRMFLDDIADGTYEGKPLMRAQLQTAENEALRAKLGLKAGDTGMVFISTFSSDKSYPLKKWDVVSHIGEYDIDNQGKVKIDGDLHLRFDYLLPKLTSSGAIPLTIIRGGEQLGIRTYPRTSLSSSIVHPR